MFTTILCPASVLDLATLQCGQSFRWEKISFASPGDSAAQTIWRGVIDDTCYSLAEIDGNIYVASTSDENEFKPVKSKQEMAKLRHYFFLDENLEKLMQVWSGYTNNTTTNKKNVSSPIHPLVMLFRTATNTLPSTGDDKKSKIKKPPQTNAKDQQEVPLLQRIRLLQQDPIEIIFSFLCSQNNHLTRITSMINLIASKCGEKVYSGSTNGKGKQSSSSTSSSRAFYKFPSCDKIAKVSEDFWRNNGFGYRAKYIVQSAKQIAKEGQDKFVKRVLDAPTLKEARSVLLELTGIGRKVADCILLGGFGKLDVAPMDTHMIAIVRTACPREIDAAGASSASSVKKKQVSTQKKNNKNNKEEDEEKKKKKENFLPAQHDEAQRLFREAFGEFAGWAQLVFFASRVKRGVYSQQQNEDDETTKKESGKRRQREE